MQEEFRYCPQCGASVTLRKLKEGDPARPVCSGCETVHFLAPKVATGVILLHEERVVLTRRDIEPGLGLWTFPGGFVEIGETVAEAAIREVREEAHAEAKLVDLLGVYSYPHSQVVIVVYQGISVGKIPSPGDEVREVGLFTEAEIPWTELAFRSVREALQDYCS